MRCHKIAALRLLNEIDLVAKSRLEELGHCRGDIFASPGDKVSGEVLGKKDFSMMHCRIVAAINDVGHVFLVDNTHAFLKLISHFSKFRLLRFWRGESVSIESIIASIGHRFVKRQGAADSKEHHS